MFTVCLYFAEPDHDEPGRRRFDIVLNGRTVAEGFDVAETAGGRMRAIVQQYEDIEIKGSLRIDLEPRQGQPILSGIEMVAEGG